MSKERIIGYFPVIHDGYVKLIDTHPEADIGILGDDILSKRFDYLRKDIRALNPEAAAKLLQGAYDKRTVQVIGESALRDALTTPEKLIMPDDDISHQLAEEFSVQPVLDPIFLRWDRRNTAKQVEVIPDRIEHSNNHDKIISALWQEGSKSPNWWRHVSAAIVSQKGVEYITHNTSVPTHYSSSIDGDPRIVARQGEAIDTTIDIHAEARLIAHCARDDGSTSTGKSIYVTTFPCMNCAKLIAEAQFSSCYYIEGYATLDGQDVLKSAGVEIVKIDTEPPPIKPGQTKIYPNRS